MERKIRNIVLTAALAIEASSCAPKNNVQIEPTPQSTPTQSSLLSPTRVPNFRDYVPTATPEVEITPTIAATLTPEQRFTIPGFNLTNTKFKIYTPDELQTLLGHIQGTNRELTGDIALPVVDPGFGNPIQDRIFEKAAENHSEGNPFYLILTNQPNHLFLDFHSLQLNSPGDLAREIGGFVYKNPEKADEMYQQKIPITTETGLVLEGQIVYAGTVSRDYFDHMGTDSPWGVHRDRDNIIFARLDKFGIPEEIANDSTPGVYYLTIIGCQNENPGEISMDLFNPGRAYAENTANRSFITIKIVIP